MEEYGSFLSGDTEYKKMKQFKSKFSPWLKAKHLSMYKQR